MTYYVWIIDVDGALVWIDGMTFKGGDSDPAREIQNVIDFIGFE